MCLLIKNLTVIINLIEECNKHEQRARSVKIQLLNTNSKSKNTKTKLNILETPSSLLDKNLPSLTISNLTSINTRMRLVNQKTLAQIFKSNLLAKETKLKSNLMPTKSTLTP